MPNNTKKEECPKCHGTGSYQYDENHGKICEVCCKHDKGFLELQGHYGADNGKMCCKAGCGYTRTKTQSDLETELSVDKNKEEHIHKYEYINIGGKSIIGCLGCSSLKPQNKKEPCGTYQMTARCMCGKGCGESSPQSPLSEEDKIEKWGVVARKDFKQSDIVAPSSNEDWEKEFDDRFELESQGCSECGGFELVDRREERYPKGKYHCEYDLEKIKDFILQQRLAAQRSLAEEIIKQLGEEPKIIDGIKTGMMAWTREGIIDFLTARGLLPKITE